MSKFSRRTLLKSATVGMALAVSAPFVKSAQPKVLRYLATDLDESAAISKQCFADTGIQIEYTAVSTDEVSRRVLTQPNSFDVLETEYFSLKNLVPSGNIQGLDTRKIVKFNDISPVITKGELQNGKKLSAQGTAPWEVLYLAGADSRQFSKTATDFVTLIPTTYNADTLGIRPDLIKRPIESWAELLNPEFKGRAALVNIPSIGMIDAAMVVEATGQYRYADKGNMTKAEIDLTMKIMTQAKKDGQFRGFWKDFNESVTLMASGQTFIQSMRSPAVTKVKSLGTPCVFQPLKEGYRSWAYGFCASKATTGVNLEWTYEFVNWFLSGWAGAHLNRQGYYSAVLPTAKAQMTANEWGFWMEGKPSVADITAPDGTVIEKAGAKRDGGSYDERMGNVACWSAIMDENDYVVKKWAEFIAA